MNNLLVLIERYLWLELTMIGEHLALARMMYEKIWLFNWGRAENEGVAQLQQDDVSNSRGCKRALLTFLCSVVQKTVNVNPGLNNKRCLNLAGLYYMVWTRQKKNQVWLKTQGPKCHENLLGIVTHFTCGTCVTHFTCCTCGTHCTCWCNNEVRSDEGLTLETSAF